MLKISELEKSVLEIDGDYETVECPVCGEDHNHILNTSVNAGGNITGVDSKGMERMQGKPTGRGTSIFITFMCECCHYWVLQLEFNKGQTLYKSYEINNLDNTESLWRD